MYTFSEFMFANGFKKWVVWHGARFVCECGAQDDAQMIANALNATAFTVRVIEPKEMQIQKTLG